MNKLVTVSGQQVEVREVAMRDLKVGDVLVEAATKANTTSMRYRHPAFPGFFHTVKSLRVMKSQIAAVTDRTVETHRADITVLVKVGE